MTRLMSALVFLAMAALPALAFAPKVESAIKVFEAIGSDQTRFDTYCAFLNAEEEIPGDTGPHAEAAIVKYEFLMNKMGSDFKEAYEAANGLVYDTPDFNAYEAAVNAVKMRCPGREAGQQ